MTTCQGDPSSFSSPVSRFGGVQRPSSLNEFDRLTRTPLLVLPDDVEVSEVRLRWELGSGEVVADLIGRTRGAGDGAGDLRGTYVVGTRTFILAPVGIDGIGVIFREFRIRSVERGVTP